MLPPTVGGMSCLLVERKARTVPRIADDANVMESVAFVPEGVARQIADDVINSYLGVQSGL
jgi:ABC-type branched-subunit amino acid transport system ATPase component